MSAFLSRYDFDVQQQMGSEARGVLAILAPGRACDKPVDQASRVHVLRPTDRRRLAECGELGIGCSLQAWSGYWRHLEKLPPLVRGSGGDGPGKENR